MAFAIASQLPQLGNSQVPALHFADKARELAEFCVRHGREAFSGWNVPTLYQYVFFHVVSRTVFCVRDRGAVTAVLFAWGMSEKDLRARMAAGQSPFAWQPSADFSDALFIAEVIGSQAQFPKLGRLLSQRWSDWRRKKVFTLRAGTLHELKDDVIERLLHGR